MPEPPLSTLGAHEDANPFATATTQAEQHELLENTRAGRQAFYKMSLIDKTEAAQSKCSRLKVSELYREDRQLLRTGLAKTDSNASVRSGSLGSGTARSSKQSSGSIGMSSSSGISHYLPSFRPTRREGTRAFIDRQKATALVRMSIAMKEREIDNLQRDLAAREAKLDAEEEELTRLETVISTCARSSDTGVVESGRDAELTAYKLEYCTRRLGDISTALQAVLREIDRQSDILELNLTAQRFLEDVAKASILRGVVEDIQHDREVQEAKLAELVVEKAREYKQSSPGRTPHSDPLWLLKTSDTLAASLEFCNFRPSLFTELGIDRNKFMALTNTQTDSDLSEIIARHNPADLGASMRMFTRSLTRFQRPPSQAETLRAARRQTQHESRKHLQVDFDFGQFRAGLIQDLDASQLHYEPPHIEELQRERIRDYYERVVIPMSHANSIAASDSSSTMRAMDRVSLELTGTNCPSSKSVLAVESGYFGTATQSATFSELGVSTLGGPHLEHEMEAESVSNTNQGLYGDSSVIPPRRPIGLSSLATNVMTANFGAGNSAASLKGFDKDDMSLRDITADTISTTPGESVAGETEEDDDDEKSYIKHVQVFEALPVEQYLTDASIKRAVILLRRSASQVIIPFESEVDILDTLKRLEDANLLRADHLQDYSTIVTNVETENANERASWDAQETGLRASIATMQAKLVKLGESLKQETQNSVEAEVDNLERELDYLHQAISQAGIRTHAIGRDDSNMASQSILASMEQLLDKTLVALSKIPVDRFQEGRRRLNKLRRDVSRDAKQAEQDRLAAERSAKIALRATKNAQTRIAGRDIKFRSYGTNKKKMTREQALLAARLQQDDRADGDVEDFYSE